MQRFVKMFMNPSRSKDFGNPDVNQIVMKIFAKFDSDRSGFLDKRETLRLLDEILESQGKPKATMSTFNRFFNEHDYNQDGVISK